MGDKLPMRISDLPHHVRERLAELPGRWRAVREGFREDPARIWHSPLTRIVALIVLGFIAVVGAGKLVGSLTPGGQLRAEKPTRVATVYVACTNRACRVSYTAHVPRDFKNWPLKCEKCGQATVYRATLCRTCRRWFATPPGVEPACPFCHERERAAAASQPEHRRGSPDDEDPW